MAKYIEMEATVGVDSGAILIGNKKPDEQKKDAEVKSEGNDPLPQS